MKASLFIFLGIVFLLNNFGYLPWGVWGFIWRFWPLILIFIGLRIILGYHRANILIIISTLLILAWIILISVAPTNPAISSWINQYLPFLPALPQGRDVPYWGT